MFNLTYIGHAGWLVEKNNFKAVFDPWFNPEGTFFNSWHQFPDNAEILSPELFTGLDFLYISHAHHDHCDEWTLEKIDKSTPIIIPNFKDKTLRSKMKQMGFQNITEMREKDEIRFKDVNIKIIIEDGFNDRDSAIVLDDGKNKIINLNDCHPSFEKIKKYADNVDLLLMQCSSAIWWPCVYDYEYEELIDKCRIKKRTVLNRTLQYSHHVNPKYVVPNAGPPIFLDKQFEFWDNTRKEDFNPFPLHDEINDFLEDNDIPSLFVIPGSMIEIQDDLVVNNTNIEKRDMIYNNLPEYIDVLRKCKKLNQTVPKTNLSGLVEKFSSLIRQIKKESKIFIHKINFPVLVEFENHSSWVIDFSLSEEKCFSEYTDQYYMYAFKFDPQIVYHLIRREQIDFDEYFLSMKFECSRKEDKFNEFLFTMFKNLDIKRFKLSESIYMTNNICKENNTETFIAEVNGKKKKIQKYCPHKFVDLEKCGVVEGNKIICPLHSWKFDLDSGNCLTSDKYKLRIEEVK